MTFNSQEPADQQPDDMLAGFAPAARVASLAEAGYLASVLEGEGIKAEVLPTKNFSATSGAWQTDYIVHARSDQLSQVAAILQAEAAAFDHDDTQSELNDRDDFRQIVWRPMALMAVAGVVSFFVGQHLATLQQRARPGALAEAVSGTGRPFYTEPSPNGVRHRLTFDRRNARWLLDIDLNGDGRFDQRHRFASEPTAAKP